RPATEATLTMQPRLARRCGSAARHTRNGAVKLTASTRCHSSSSISSTRPNCGTPATLATTSRRPWVPTTCASAASTAARSVTSPATTSTPSGPAPSRSNPTTVAPSPRNRSATARPMPEAHPVTKATRRGSGPLPLLSSLTAAVCHPARSARRRAGGVAGPRRRAAGRAVGGGGAARRAVRAVTTAPCTPEGGSPRALGGTPTVGPALGRGRRGRALGGRGRRRRGGAAGRPVDRRPGIVTRVGGVAGAGAAGGVAGPRPGGGRRRAAGRPVPVLTGDGPVGPRRSVGVRAVAAVAQQGADGGAGAVRAPRERLVPDGLDQGDRPERGEEDDGQGDGRAPADLAEACPQGPHAAAPGLVGPVAPAVGAAAVPLVHRRAGGAPLGLAGEADEQPLLELQLAEAPVRAPEPTDVEGAADHADHADHRGAEHRAGDAEERRHGRARHRGEHRAEHLDARDLGAVVICTPVATVAARGGLGGGCGIGAGAGRAHSGGTARSCCGGRGRWVGAVAPRPLN